MNKDMRNLVKEAERLGVEVTFTRKSHLRFATPQGAVIAPSTPSCPRSILNTRADLKRHGVPL